MATFTMKGLFQGTSDLRDLTQYKYVKQTVLPKHFNVTSTLTSFLESKQFMRVPLTSKFLVQPSNAECGGLETAYKDSRQMFQHSNRMFEEILQISFKISFGT